MPLRFPSLAKMLSPLMSPRVPVRAQPTPSRASLSAAAVGKAAAVPAVSFLKLVEEVAMKTSHKEADVSLIAHSLLDSIMDKGKEEASKKRGGASSL